MWSRSSNGESPGGSLKGNMGGLFGEGITTSLSIPRKPLLCRSVINSSLLNIVDLESTPVFLDLPLGLLALTRLRSWAAVTSHCPVSHPFLWLGDLQHSMWSYLAFCSVSTFFLEEITHTRGKDAVVHLSPPFISAPDLWTQLPTESSNPWKACLHLVELFLSFSRDLLFPP